VNFFRAFTVSFVSLLLSWVLKPQLNHLGPKIQSLTVAHFLMVIDLLRSLVRATRTRALSPPALSLSLSLYLMRELSPESLSHSTVSLLLLSRVCATRTRALPLLSLSLYSLRESSSES